MWYFSPVTAKLKAPCGIDIINCDPAPLDSTALGKQYTVCNTQHTE